MPTSTSAALTRLQLLYVAEAKVLTVGAPTATLVDNLRRGALVPNPLNLDGFDNGQGDALGNIVYAISLLRPELVKQDAGSPLGRALASVRTKGVH